MTPPPSTTAVLSVSTDPEPVEGSARPELVEAAAGLEPVESLVERNTLFAIATAAGLLGQAALLPPSASSPSAWIGLLALLVAIAALLWIGRRRSAGWIAAAVLAGSLGGLGMVLGHRLDGTPLELCAGPLWNALGRSAPLFGWSSALMLAGCLASCLWTCPAAHPLSALPSWIRHTACLGAMWLGMLSAARLLRALDWTALGSPLLMHAAMVLGMMTAAAALHAVFYPVPPVPAGRRSLKIR